MGGWTLDDVGVYELTASEGGTGDIDMPGDGEGADGADDEIGEVSACGCSSSTGPGPAGLAVLGLVGLALVRRRQD
jgi:MYXO-CTERM domain-containing protein